MLASSHTIYDLLLRFENFVLLFTLSYIYLQDSETVLSPYMSQNLLELKRDEMEIFVL